MFSPPKAMVRIFPLIVSILLNYSIFKDQLGHAQATSVLKIGARKAIATVHLFVVSYTGLLFT